VAKQCEEWANLAFNGSSPTRDEGFVTCITKRDPSASREDLLHRLETGDGSGLYDRLMSGGNLPIASESDHQVLRERLVEKRPVRFRWCPPSAGSLSPLISSA
jgi:hypothetical protein